MKKCLSKKKMQTGGPTALSPEDAVISNYLMQKNRGVNFVDRAFNSKTNPKIRTNQLPGEDLEGRPYADYPKRMTSSHIMSEDWGPSDNQNRFPGPYRVYPTLVEANKGQLQYMPGDAGYDYAMETGQFIEAPTRHIASALASYGYKKSAGIPTKQTGGVAYTPGQQAMGLNNPAFDAMYFPVNGQNTFRGLDSGQPVQLVDANGKRKVLRGADDTDSFTGAVHEQRMQVGGHLQSGVVVDKYKNQAKIIKNFNAIDSFPVITGANYLSNRPNKGSDTSEAKSFKTRTTPTGNYNMIPEKDLYGYKGYSLEGNPNAESLALHTTYDPVNRFPTYKSLNPKDRAMSYGCVNCRNEDIDKIYRNFPQGDTLQVINSYPGTQVPQKINEPRINNNVVQNNSPTTWLPPQDGQDSLHYDLRSYQYGGDSSGSQPLNRDNYNAFNQYARKNDPAYGTDSLNHGQYGNNTLNSFNQANPAQAIHPNDIGRYQQDMLSLNSSRPGSVLAPFGLSPNDSKLGQKTEGQHYMNYERVHQGAWDAKTGSYPTLPDSKYYGTNYDAFAAAGKAPAINYSNDFSAAPVTPISNVQDAGQIDSDKRAAMFPSLSEAKANRRVQKANWHTDEPQMQLGGPFKPTGPYSSQPLAGYPETVPDPTPEELDRQRSMQRIGTPSVNNPLFNSQPSEPLTMEPTVDAGVQPYQGRRVQPTADQWGNLLSTTVDAVGTFGSMIAGVNSAKQADRYAQGMGLSDNAFGYTKSDTVGNKGDYVNTGTALGQFRPNERTPATPSSYRGVGYSQTGGTPVDNTGYKYPIRKPAKVDRMAHGTPIGEEGVSDWLKHSIRQDQSQDIQAKESRKYTKPIVDGIRAASAVGTLVPYPPIKYPSMAINSTLGAMDVYNDLKAGNRGQAALDLLTAIPLSGVSSTGFTASAAAMHRINKTNNFLKGVNVLGAADDISQFVDSYQVGGETYAALPRMPGEGEYEPTHSLTGARPDMPTQSMPQMQQPYMGNNLVTPTQVPDGEIDIEAALKAVGKGEGGKLGTRTSLVGSGGKRATASGTYQMTTPTVKGIYDAHFKGQYDTFASFKQAFDTNPNVEHATAKAHMTDLSRKYGIFAIGAWYSPMFARKAAQGDMTVFSQVPSPEYGNKITWGDDYKKKLKTYNKLVASNRAYQQGGEYDVNDQELQAILAAGGTVEYL